MAYVFAHLLPQVAAGQEALAEVGAARLVVGEGHVWLLALLGLVVFYGLERAALVSRADDADDEPSAGVFWIHMASYGLYNALIGYLLTHGEAQTGTERGLFWVAMALHFCVNDAGLRAHHRDTYDRVGRWGLAAAVVAGTAVGLGTAVHPAVVAGLVAFLAGGVVLNTLKEELPEEPVLAVRARRGGLRGPADGALSHRRRGGRGQAVPWPAGIDERAAGTVGSASEGRTASRRSSMARASA